MGTHHLPSLLTPNGGCLDSSSIRAILSPGPHGLAPGSPLSPDLRTPGSPLPPPPHSWMTSPPTSALQLTVHSYPPAHVRPCSLMFPFKFSLQVLLQEASPNPDSLPETAYVLLAFMIIALQPRMLSRAVQWIRLLPDGNAVIGPHFAALAVLRVRAPDPPVR